MDIKRFYDFTDNQDGLEYFHCNSCGSIYPHFKPKNFICKYCQSKDVNGITEEEFYNELELRSNPDDFEEILKHKSDIQNVNMNLIYPISYPHYLTDDKRLNWIAKD